MPRRNIGFIAGSLLGLGVAFLLTQNQTLMFIGGCILVAGILLYLSPLGDRRRVKDKVYLRLEVSFDSDETVIDFDPKALATLTVEEQKNLWASLIYSSYEMNGQLLDDQKNLAADDFPF